MFSGLDLDASLRRLSAHYGDAEVAEHRDALMALFVALKQCALFHAVFADLDPGTPAVAAPEVVAHAL
jgi:hypothetical protein